MNRHCTYRDVTLIYEQICEKSDCSPIVAFPLYYSIVIHIILLQDSEEKLKDLKKKQDELTQSSTCHGHRQSNQIAQRKDESPKLPVHMGY